MRDSLLPIPGDTYFTLLIICYVGFWIGAGVSLFSTFFFPVIWLVVMTNFIVLYWQDKGDTALALQRFALCLALLAPCLFLYPIASQ